MNIKNTLLSILLCFPAYFQQAQAGSAHDFHKNSHGIDTTNIDQIGTCPTSICGELSWKNGTDLDFHALAPDGRTPYTGSNFDVGKDKNAPFIGTPDRHVGWKQKQLEFDGVTISLDQDNNTGAIDDPATGKRIEKISVQNAITGQYGFAGHVYNNPNIADPSADYQIDIVTDGRGFITSHNDLPFYQEKGFLAREEDKTQTYLVDFVDNGFAPHVNGASITGLEFTATAYKDQLQHKQINVGQVGKATNLAKTYLSKIPNSQREKKFTFKDLNKNSHFVKLDKNARITAFNDVLKGVVHQEGVIEQQRRDIEAARKRAVAKRLAEQRRIKIQTQQNNIYASNQKQADIDNGLRALGISVDIPQQSRQGYYVNIPTSQLRSNPNDVASEEAYRARANLKPTIGTPTVKVSTDGYFEAENIENSYLASIEPIANENEGIKDWLEYIDKEVKKEEATQLLYAKEDRKKEKYNNSNFIEKAIIDTGLPDWLNKEVTDPSLLKANQFVEKSIHNTADFLEENNVEQGLKTIGDKLSFNQFSKAFDNAEEAGKKAAQITNTEGVNLSSIAQGTSIIVGSTLTGTARLTAGGLGTSVVIASPFKILGRNSINLNIYRNLEQQLLKHGAGSIFKGLRKAKKTLKEHIEKLPTLVYKSQVEGTIRRVAEQIRTIEKFIRDKGL